MGFVVDVHELADGGVRVFLRGGEGLVAEEFLNGAEVGAVGEEMRGEGMAEGVGMQVPVYVDEADVFFDDAADGTLREAAAGIIQENGFGVRGFAVAAAAVGGLQEQLLTQRPIFFQRFLGFRAVGDDAFLVALAADTQHEIFSFDVGQVEASEFADPKAGGVEQFEEGAVATEQEAFLFKSGKFARRSIRVPPHSFLGRLASGAGSGTHFRELIQKAVHLFGGEDGRDAFGQFGSGDQAGGIFLQAAFADAVLEKGAERGQFAGDRAFLKMLVVQIADEFADGVVRDGG